MLKKTTIADIAKAAGVSISTVSRILNNRPDVAEETRQRVLQVIEQEQFVPQFAWQQLRSGKSRFIALHFPQDFNPPAQNIITSAALCCEQAGYSLNLIASSLGEGDLLNIYRSGQADAMILMEVVTHDWRIELLREQGLRFAMIGRCADNTGLSYVDVDIGAGVIQAMAHLVSLGHRNIGLVTMAPISRQQEYGYTTWARKGYEAACRQFNLPNYWRAAEVTGEAVTDTVTTLLDQHPAVTALIMPQHTGVPGLLRAVLGKGLRIPDDISIVGLAGDPLAEMVTPPLTTLSFPGDEMGWQAATILLSQLNGISTRPQQILLSPELTIRGSTGPVRSQT